MKKILVLSDSHGNVNNMILAVKRENPDMILHLGDCMADALFLHKKFPNIPMEQVPGNCDYSQEFAERLIEVEGKKIFFCHGHSLNVKASYLPLQMRAREMEADAALFGHTHQIFYDKHNHINFLNPGSIGAPRYGNEPSYGLVLVDEGTGSLDIGVRYLE